MSECGLTRLHRLTVDVFDDGGGGEAEAEPAAVAAGGSGRQHQIHRHAGPEDLHRERGGGTGLQGIVECGETTDTHAGDGGEPVVLAETGGSGGGAGLHLVDQHVAGGGDADAADLLVGGQLRVDGHVLGPVAALQGEDGVAPAGGVAAGTGDEGLEDVLPAVDGAAVDGEEAVAHLQTGLGGGAGDDAVVRQFDGGADVADLGGAQLGADLHAEYPQSGGKQQGEEHVEGRAGDGDDDLVEKTDGRELFGLGLAALQFPQVGQLGQPDVTAEQDPGNPPLGAAAVLPAHDFRSKADGEMGGDDAPPAGGEEVAELVDEDRKPEANDRHDQRPGRGEQRFEEASGHGNSFSGWRRR